MVLGVVFQVMTSRAIGSMRASRAGLVELRVWCRGGREILMSSTSMTPCSTAYWPEHFRWCHRGHREVNTHTRAHFQYAVRTHLSLSESSVMYNVSVLSVVHEFVHKRAVLDNIAYTYIYNYIWFYRCMLYQHMYWLVSWFSLTFRVSSAACTAGLSSAVTGMCVYLKFYLQNYMFNVFMLFLRFLSKHRDHLRESFLIDYHGYHRTLMSKCWFAQWCLIAWIDLRVCLFFSTVRGSALGPEEIRYTSDRTFIYLIICIVICVEFVLTCFCMCVFSCFGILVVTEATEKAAL